MPKPKEVNTMGPLRSLRVPMHRKWQILKLTSTLSHHQSQRPYNTSKEKKQNSINIQLNIFRATNKKVFLEIVSIYFWKTKVWKSEASLTPQQTFPIHYKTSTHSWYFISIYTSTGMRNNKTIFPSWINTQVWPEISPMTGAKYQMLNKRLDSVRKE